MIVKMAVIKMVAIISIQISVARRIYFRCFCTALFLSDFSTVLIRLLQTQTYSQRPIRS